MKFFKGKSKKSVKTEAPAPRELTEIQTHYNDLCSKAGQLQYELSVKNKDLERLNELLMSVNHEAAARLKLDKENEAAKPAPVEESK